MAPGGGHDGSAVNDARGPRARDGLHVPVLPRVHYGSYPERTEVAHSH